jgi:hypothetical protein
VPLLGIAPSTLGFRGNFGSIREDALFCNLLPLATIAIGTKRQLGTTGDRRESARKKSEFPRFSEPVHKRIGAVNVKPGIPAALTTEA